MTRARERLDRLVEPEPIEALRDRGALAAGEDQRVEAVELLRAAHRDRLRAGARERARVRGDVALDRENADALRHDYHPRVASRSCCASFSISMPGIAAARPRLAASTSAG